MKMKLEAAVRIERLTLYFIRIVDLCVQQLVHYSSTIRPYSITAHSVHICWQFYWHYCPPQVFISAKRRPASFKGFTDCLLPILAILSLNPWIVSDGLHRSLYDVVPFSCDDQWS